MRMLLVMSSGGSLKRWWEEGIIKREMALYLHYLREGHLSRLYIFTYAPDDELELIGAPEDLLARIALIRPTRPLTSCWSRFAYALSSNTRRQVARLDFDVVKTNQIGGAWTALMLSRRRAVLYARAGYLRSRYHKLRGDWLLGCLYRMFESVLFRSADLISVTSEGGARLARHRLSRPDKVFVAKTYVDTVLFWGHVEDKDIVDDLLFVGRLEPEKNALALIRACGICRVGLVLVGNGSLRSLAKQLADQSSVRLRIIDKISNDEIALLLRRYKYFVLPSLHEGLPKALIEAMACETICIGTSIAGITDLICDGETGYLAAGTSDEDIAEAIARARADRQANAVARAGARYVRDKHSIAAYAEQELFRLREAVARRRQAVQQCKVSGRA